MVTELGLCPSDDPNCDCKVGRAAAAAQAAAIPGGSGTPDWCIYPIIRRSSSSALA